MAIFKFLIFKLSLFTLIHLVSHTVGTGAGTVVSTSGGFTIIPALGRRTIFNKPIVLGTFYDSKTHNFIPNISIFKTGTNLPQEIQFSIQRTMTNISSQNENRTSSSSSSSSSVHFIASTEERFKLANISPTISLAILSELIPGTSTGTGTTFGIEGSSKFVLNEPKTKTIGKNNANQKSDKKITATKQSLEKFQEKLFEDRTHIIGVKISEAIITQELLNILDPNLHRLINLERCSQFNNDTGTHFVAGILYGGRHITEVKTTEEIPLKIERQVKSEIQNYFNNNNNSKIDTENVKLDLTVYSDINTNGGVGVFQFPKSGNKSFDFDKNLAASNGGKGVPMGYILLPIPLLKSYMKLNFFYKNHEITNPISPKIPNAPFNFIGPATARKFFTVFDQVYQAREKINAAISQIDNQQNLPADSKDYDADGYNHNEIQTTEQPKINTTAFLGRLWKLEMNFEESVTHFKASLRDKFKAAAVLAENCEGAKGLVEIEETLSQYKDDEHSPIKVNLAVTEILVKYEKLLNYGKTHNFTDPGELEKCKTTLNLTRIYFNEVTDNLKKCERDKKRLEDRISDLLKENEVCRKGKEKLENENRQLRQEKDKLKQEKDKLIEENAKLRQEKDKLSEENAKLRQEKDKLREENEKLRQDKDKLRREKEKLVQEIEELRKCCSIMPVPPVANVTAMCEEDINDLKKDPLYCDEIQQCIGESSGYYELNGTLNNTLYVAINGDLPSNNTTDIERLVCLYNLYVTYASPKLENESVRASLVKHIVENLAGCSNGSTAVMHSRHYFQGTEEIYNFDQPLKGKYDSITGCMDLSAVSGRVNSLDTRGTCVRLFSERKCRGESQLFAGVRVGWSKIAFAKEAVSIGRCY